MAHVTRRVQRPALLGAFCVFAFVAHASAAFGLLNLQSLHNAPAAPLYTAVDRLADALVDSPWVNASMGQTELWLVAPADCDRCGELQSSLAAADLALRVVVIAPRDLGERVSREHRLAATLARSRDMAALTAWRDGRERASFVSAEDPSAVEGYVEWGRASLDRVSEVLLANGVKPELPILLWRNGRQWRVLTGKRALSIDPIRREMAAEG
jgi:hypothetical protein